ncbi:MAG: hypothetical protein ACO3AG_01780 [Fluviibacter sp.]
MYSNPVTTQGASSYWSTVYNPSYTQGTAGGQNPTLREGYGTGTAAIVNTPTTIEYNSLNNVTRRTDIKLNDVVNRMAGTFNPPPHIVSRSESPIAFYQNSEYYETHHITAELPSGELIEQLSKANSRGFLYQDLDSYAVGSRALGQLYGFQFMYNPQSWSHSNRINTSVDYVLGNNDVANLLAGTQSFTIQLFLNRVADMSTLRVNDAILNVTNAFGDLLGRNYPRRLAQEEVDGIATRGTEYDLEFLYRCANGDPKLGPSMDAATADFGWLAGWPVWLRFNDYVRYKGIINDITVNHVLFTKDMVPMITEVTIDFMRLPTPVYGTAEAVAAVISGNRSPYLQSQTATPAT